MKKIKNHTIKQSSIVLFFLLVALSCINANPVITIISAKGYHEKITLRYYVDFIRTRESKPFLEKEIPAGSNAVTWKLPTIIGHGYIEISAIHKKSSHIIAPFLVKTDDQITVTIEPDTVLFAGRGSKRMQCQYELAKISYRIFYKKDPVFKMPASQILPELNRRRDSILIHCESIIQSYRLPEKITEQLLAETRSLFLYLKMSGFKVNLYSPQHILDDSIRPYYHNNWRQVTFSTKKTKRTAYYTDMVFQKIMADIYADGYQQKNRMTNPDFLTVLKKINRDFRQTDIWEKLVTICVAENFFSNNESDSALQQLLTNVHTPDYLGILKETYQRMVHNQPVFDFSLPDEKNKIWHFNSLRNKVVVIESWFTGCTTCIELNGLMNAVAAHFKNDNSVLFININADMDRNRWLASLATGKYSHPDGINLFTRGLGYNHPFMKYYNYIGFPRLLIADKNGRLYSSGPFYLKLPDFQQKMIAMIEDCKLK